MASQRVTLVSFVKDVPEFVECVKPPQYKGTQTSPSIPGIVRIILEPPVPGESTLEKFAPPSVLIIITPLVLLYA